MGKFSLGFQWFAKHFGVSVICAAISILLLRLHVDHDPHVLPFGVDGLVVVLKYADRKLFRREREE